MRLWERDFFNFCIVFLILVGEVKFFVFCLKIVLWKGELFFIFFLGNNKWIIVLCNVFMKFYFL